MRRSSRPGLPAPHVRHHDPQASPDTPARGAPERAAVSASEPEPRPTGLRLRSAIKAGPMGSPLLAPP